jgi:endonuclease-3
MSASNRASLITKLHTALKKHYKPLPAQPTRPLLEHLLYACLLEDSPTDLADEGIAKCEQEFFDWNEVRVTTVTELAQVLANLPDPQKAARRLKSNLQAVFEEFYTFDLDHLKKENLGKAVSKFEKMPGMTPFVLNYTVQHGLGGHAIPVDYAAMVIMLATEIASQSEAMSGKVPGLERAIPKSKGIEFAGLLHQAAVALNKNNKDKTARDLLDSVSKGSSNRLDQWLASKKAAKKRVVKRKAEERAAAEAEQEILQSLATSPAEKTKPAAKVDATAKKKAKKSSEQAAAPAPPPTPPAPPVPAPKKKTKKPVESKSAPAKPANKKKSTRPATPATSKKKTSKKSVNRKLTKSKPR